MNEIKNLEMPPSVNKLYFVKGGRKILSAKGRSIKQRLKSSILQQVHTWKEFEEKPLEVELHLYFEDVENKGWPTKAKSRYKRIDASNRAKLLEDALSECLGIDDSLFFSIKIVKKKSEGEPYCDVRIGYL